MKRDFYYVGELCETDFGRVLQFDLQLRAASTRFEVDAIRLHPEHGLETLKETYWDPSTGKTLEVILDSAYPKQWFALECCEPASGTEVPMVLGLKSQRKVAGAKSTGKPVVVLSEYKRRIKLS